MKMLFRGGVVRPLLPSVEEFFLFLVEGRRGHGGRKGGGEMLLLLLQNLPPLPLLSLLTLARSQKIGSAPLSPVPDTGHEPVKHDPIAELGGVAVLVELKLRVRAVDVTSGERYCLQGESHSRLSLGRVGVVEGGGCVTNLRPERHAHLRR